MAMCHVETDIEYNRKSCVDACIMAPSSSNSQEKTESVSFFSFPWRVKLIILNEVCERFSYYGFRAILSLYLSDVLKFTEDQSISIYSNFSALAYCTPLIGGHISDAYWGRYKTIVVFSCIYLCGSLVLSGGAWELLNPSNLVWPLFVAMSLTSIGTGGIKPCVSTFGADQLTQPSTQAIAPVPEKISASDLRSSSTTLLSEIEICNNRSYDSRSGSEDDSSLSRRSPLNLFPSDPPSSPNSTSDSSSPVELSSEMIAEALAEENRQQELRTQSFFYMFYFSMNLGSVFSLLLIPYIRSHVSYAAAFALPAFFLFISILILIFGNAKDLFVKIPPSTSPLMLVMAVFVRACKNKKKYDQGYDDINTHINSAFNVDDQVQDEVDQANSILASLNPDLDSSTSSVEIVDDSEDQLAKKIEEAEQANHTAKYAGFMDWLDAATFPTAAASDSRVYAGDSEEDVPYSRHDVRDTRRLLSLIPIFSTLPFFWCLMNQQGSTWVYQAKDMDLTLFGTYKIEPEQLQVINPIVLFILLPFFEWMFRSASNTMSNLRKRRHNANDQNVNDDDLEAESESQSSFCQRIFAISTLGKLGLGFFVASMAYLIAAIVDFRVFNSAPQTVSIWFQIPQYVLVTAAEVLVSVTGLHFAFEKAPKSMKSLVTALLMLSSAVGDFITGVFYNIFVSFGLERYQMFIVFAVGMLVNLGYFFVIKVKYGKMFV